MGDGTIFNALKGAQRRHDKLSQTKNSRSFVLRARGIEGQARNSPEGKPLCPKMHSAIEFLALWQNKVKGILD
jgi:hypothetical protein